MRAHITVPEALIAEVDKLVGHRKRSRFFVEIVAKEVSRLKLLRAMEKAGGAIAESEVPAWDTPESTSAWVEQLRQVDAKHLDELHTPNPKP